MPAVSAVVTTGIYCHPHCSARPHPRNVRSYASPAAAEAAGFRACMRCRPYRAVDPVTWAGPELVCRAVQLVVDGALDDGTEADLGRRVGVSPRHLRRLFVEHLGVTPDELARSRRAHFARRLLDDTDLPVTDVAFASGFGSVRQFNRAMAATFRSTPKELRERRRAADRLVADGGLTLRLPHTTPYDWPAVAAYLAARATPGVESVDEDTYRRTIRVDGLPAVIEVAPGGSDHLLLTAHLPRWEGLIHLVQRVRRMVAVDLDTDAAHAHLVDDPVIGPLVAGRPGARPPGAWDPFEVGVRAIIGQQVSVGAANTITGRLVGRHGRPVPGLGAMGLTHLFPDAERLADPDADLGGLGLTTARTSAIRSFATAVAGDAIRFDRSLPLDDLVAAVTSVPGLGPWTAHYLALRLGEPDAFPATDLALRRSAARLTGSTITPRQLEEMSQRWRPHRALAALHLWGAATP